MVLADDGLRDLQNRVISEGNSQLGHWGTDPRNFTSWGSHTNRLVPVCTYGTCCAGPGIDLEAYVDSNSPYRNESLLQEIYGRIPKNTLNPNAHYFDQTNIADIQRAGLTAGKKHIFLVVFDGMDWQTTWAAAIYKTGKIPYRTGRGTGLHFLDYDANRTTQYGYMVTSPYGNRTQGNPDTQQLVRGTGLLGGYNVVHAGPNPWTSGDDPFYLVAAAKSGSAEHAYADSSSSATAMTTGIKTYNGAINVDVAGNQLTTIAHLAQQQGYSVGTVSSVPFNHATPATAYAHNVSRRDYQDLARDMLGLASVAHPQKPLPGLDVVLGGGYGVISQNDAKNQGENFVPGNQFVTDDDLGKIDVNNGGNYVIAKRTAGADGQKLLQQTAQKAVKQGRRLFGFFGVGSQKGHLPYQTANGDYHPAMGRTKKKEVYSQQDLDENPTLEAMTKAAIHVLSQNKKGFWLMMEPGDVDWANHDNNIDNSIGAVLSGDTAVKVITDWVDQNSNWQESLLIIAGDHGHYFVLLRPEMLIQPE